MYGQHVPRGDHIHHPGGAPAQLLHVDDLDPTWPQQGAAQSTIGVPAGRGPPGCRTIPGAATTKPR